MDGGRPAEIEIGVTGPFTGTPAHLGREMRQAAQLAVDEVNAAGGVHGNPVVAVTADDRGRPEAGAEVARAFRARAALLGVVGPDNSNVALDTAPIYRDADLAMVHPIVSHPALTERRMSNVFRLTNRDDVTARAIASYLRRERGKSHCAVVETATTYGRSMAAEFVRAFTALGGEVRQRYTVEEGDTDFAPLVRRLPAELDLVFYGGSFEGAGIVTAMRSAGLSQLFATGDGCWDRAAFLEPAGRAAAQGEGALVLAASPATGHVPGSAEFAHHYERRFGPIGNYAVNSYDAARLLLAAVAAVTRDAGGVPDRRRTLEAVRAIEFRGIAYPEPTRWDAAGDNLATGTFLNTVVDGRFQQVAAVPRQDRVEPAGDNRA
ncbi:branched-chain amino acid ABC transporter substrate-binding protein [Planosporangium sp. 12N6]|uniref:branched-chain amino acid ABC transporter substrate-binding protein n=1 Tax=Planosporangium spinosum TaxID=3402278 RepID=UPI003CFA24A0